jgi:hypothetical protein
MMAAMSLGHTTSSQFERTALEIAAAAAQSAFRAGHRQRLRERIRATDRLLDEVERTRLLELALVPTATWAGAVRLAREVAPALLPRLRRERHPDSVGSCLFAIQEQLLRESQGGRPSGLAPVIPLFPTT